MRHYSRQRNPWKIHRDDTCWRIRETIRDREIQKNSQTHLLEELGQDTSLRLFQTEESRKKSQRQRDSPETEQKCHSEQRHRDRNLVCNMLITTDGFLRSRWWHRHLVGQVVVSNWRCLFWPLQAASRLWITVLASVSSTCTELLVDCVKTLVRDSWIRANQHWMRCSSGWHMNAKTAAKACGFAPRRLLHWYVWHCGLHDAFCRSVFNWLKQKPFPHWFECCCTNERLKQPKEKLELFCFVGLGCCDIEHNESNDHADKSYVVYPWWTQQQLVTSVDQICTALQVVNSPYVELVSRIDYFHCFEFA